MPKGLDNHYIGIHIATESHFLLLIDP